MTLECSVCNTKKQKIIRKIDNYKLIRCANCRVVFLSPKPNSQIENNLRKYESTESIQSYIKMKSLLSDRAENCVKKLKIYKSKGELLDVGCSYGYYLQIFKKYGYTIKGIDISEKAIDYIVKRKNIKALVGSFETYHFDNNSFDIITMFDVLEHFSDPVKIINKVKKLLKKNGIVIIQTPNFDSLMSKITGKKWFWLLVPQHIFLYSITSLQYLLTKNGFRILYLKTWDDHHEFTSNLLSLFGINYWGRTKLLHRILVKFKKIVVIFSYLWNIFNLGGEIIIYAQKT